MMNNMINQSNPNNNFCGYPQTMGVNNPFVGGTPKQGTPTLSKEEFNLLKQKVESMFKITDVDIAVGKCNHRDEHGNLLLNFSGDWAYCPVCQQRFRMSNELTKEEVESYCSIMQWILNTVKTMWINVPTEYAARVFANMYNVLRQLPDIWEVSQREFANLENYTNSRVTAYGGGNAGYAQLYQQPAIGMPTPNYNPNAGYYQQMGAMGTNPMMGASPMNPMMGNNQMMGGNPMMGASPMNPMMGNSQMMGYVNQPMPVGGTQQMMSGFVQGGVVPTPTPTMSQQDVQQAAAALPLPGQPPVVPPQNNNNNNTATTTTTVKV